MAKIEIEIDINLRCSECNEVLNFYSVIDTNFKVFQCKNCLSNINDKIFELNSEIIKLKKQLENGNYKD